MSTGDESPPGQSLRDWAEADATCCWGGTRPSTIVAMTPGVVSAESGATEAMGARILPHESASIRAMAADFEAWGGGFASGDGSSSGSLFCSSYVSWMGSADGNAMSGTTPPGNGFWRHDESVDWRRHTARKGATCANLE